VGKGARNRAKRKAEAARGRPEELIEKLWALDGPDELLALLDRYPDLEHGRAGEQLRQMAGMPGFGAGFAPFVHLIVAARTQPEAAWAEFERRRDEANQAGKDLERTLAAVEAASAAQDHDTVVALAAPAAEAAESVGLGLVAGRFHSQHGLALLRRTSADRAHDLEQAIKVHEIALEYAEPGEWTASLLAHLGLVYAERVRGDRAENLALSAELLRAALAEAPPDGDPELHALIRTNLAMALLRGELGDRRALLREAVELCRSALEYRSPDRDSVNWAYSQLNLGEVVEELAALDGVDPREAVDAYQRVVNEAARIPEPWLVGGAHHALGRLRSRAAGAIAEALEELDDLDPSAEEERLALLRQAHVDLLAAERQMHNAPDPLRRGYMLNDLGGVAAALGLVDEAIGWDREALRILRPTASPRACTTVGWRLGNLLAERDDWAEAAAAFEDAVEAAELSFHGRLATTARREEIQRVGNLKRWAAFAVARAGDALRAALALENGRARELRRRVGLNRLSSTELADVPNELLEALRQSVDALATAPIDVVADDPAHRFQAVLAEIRSLPGHEAFGTGAVPDDLLAAVDEAWPVAYVDPTPFGTLLIVLRRVEGELAVEAYFLEPRALDVFLQLTLGLVEDELAAALAGDDPQRGSYFLAISGDGEETDFHRHLEQPLPWLGANIVRHIRDVVTVAGASGVTLIGCGPIGAAPLHAATWDEGGEQRCLLDDLNVRYVPSATICAAARRRAERAVEHPRLVLMADPTSDLSAARAEADEIRRHFSEDRVIVAVADAADRTFLEQHAAAATHLHFASHGEASLLGGGDAAVWLGDGPLPAAELAALRCPHLRLAVVSACQSGMSDTSQLPDEVVSVGAVMLAAGSASAVASLWSVPSLATAILMTRFYDELFVHGLPPAEALRQAQLWLRGLTEAREAEFLSAHPALADEFRHHAARGDIPGRRSPGASPDASTTPYSRPDYWAAFIVLGA
jgi:tetratricopeptide (TPR) repeat protein